MSPVPWKAGLGCRWFTGEAVSEAGVKEQREWEGGKEGSGRVGTGGCITEAVASEDSSGTLASVGHASQSCPSADGTRQLLSFVGSLEKVLKERVERHRVCRRQALAARASCNESQRRVKGTRSIYCRIVIPVFQKRKWKPRGVQRRVADGQRACD